MDDLSDKWPWFVITRLSTKALTRSAFHTDPAFTDEYRKLTGGDEPTPLMPNEQAMVVKEIPRDAETIELFKKFAGTGPLPSG